MRIKSEFSWIMKKQNFGDYDRNHMWPWEE